MNDEQRVRESNERKGRGLFYLVIAIATFIIMAVGATFAFFTATTSSGSASVQTGSTTLRLKYISYNAGWMYRDLIPVESYIAEYSFERQNDTTLSDAAMTSNIMCKDDYGNSVCSVYVFQVYNSANSPQTVSIDVRSENNGFVNLRTFAYEIELPTDSEQLALYNSTDNHNGEFDPTFRKGTDGEDPDDATLINVTDNLGTLLTEGNDVASNQYSPIYVNRNGVVKRILTYKDTSDGDALKPTDVGLIQLTDENRQNPALRTARIADNVTIGGGSTKTFALVLYIKETGSDQTVDDASQTFTGQVIVDSGDGTSGVTGTISASLGTEGDLQTGQTVNEPSQP